MPSSYLFYFVSFFFCFVSNFVLFILKFSGVYVNFFRNFYLMQSKSVSFGNKAVLKWLECKPRQCQPSQAMSSNQIKTKQIFL